MTTFQIFSNLPIELRAAIWRHTVEPRTVEVRTDKLIGYSTELKPPSYWLATPVPAALQTCREARKLGLYQQVRMRWSSTHAEDRYVWINLEIDVVSIGTCRLGSLKQIAPLIKKLRFERENTNESWLHWETQDIKLFENVRDIHVDCADGLGDWQGASKENYWPWGFKNLYFIDPDDGEILRSDVLDLMLLNS
ncbi:G-patch domain-containing protein [Elsinoe australis]|uniref:G-patch domain-containing protein n=1 Tax=Elsinoe australis TaxID=40998 RepID=A0A2P7Z1T2_9PEZI|nr:G-patch domain-containing protein [Elsinoe australis]